MAELTQEQRLALAVKAQVAAIRADQARERGALIRRRVEPVHEAHARFVKLYGREPDLDAPGDKATMGALFEATGAGGVTGAQLEAAARSSGEVGQADLEAAGAMKALAEALSEGATVLEWLGVDEDTFSRTVEQALEEG